MVTNTNIDEDDRNSKYQQAVTAYKKGDYEVAARLIDQAVHNLPSDPHSHLLRGHIYYVLQQFNIAKAEYENVFDLTEDQEIVASAIKYSESIKQYLFNVGEDESAVESMDLINSVEASEDSLEDISLNNLFSIDLDTLTDIDKQDNSIDFSHDSLTLDQLFSELETTSNDAERSEDLELLSFWEEGISSQENTGISAENTYLSYLDTNSKPQISLTSEYQTNLPFLGEISTNNLKEKIAEEFEPVAEPNTNTQTSSFKHNLSDDEESESDDDYFDLEAFQSAFGSESFTTDEEADAIVRGENSANDSSASLTDNIEFLRNFEDFDDLGNIPSFEIPPETEDQDTSASAEIRETSDTNNRSFAKDSLINSIDDNKHIGTDEEVFRITGNQEAVPVFTPSDVSALEPNVKVKKGLFAFFENASLETKQWYVASTVGLTSAVAAALISFGVTTFSHPEERESVRNTDWVIALSAGLTGAITSGFMGNLAFREVRRTTNEAQRKAVEQEEAKENLQREVIRLLEDVERAARGDLTVKAQVTADVLGSVADAFNLTIQNPRDIAQQVKIAATEVMKGSSNSETFARTLSGDALRQTEELAVTLNSVQVMTESIKRVADAAKETEVVARDASLIALKGGEAIENTVVGILEIRETVAETTRKVKRLAESSQEINSIVALVSQIASGSNLLALNASIEAARAGEAGRGFAIVADEVRQLADKSAKSLKQIEQIVMQIQSETSSVMTAMEEGTQQVIKGTKLAEEAKRSLDDIIQVTGHIDSLVRSMTADTVEQTETSLAVAQVMQSVELTAQETSQEAQRVSGALQHLVRVSRDLIVSVECF